ncbi:MAG: site-specific integrase [Qipengyuania pacifica]
MKTELPANVRPVRDRHGKIRYRFRRKGWPSVYLSGEPGSPEFHRSYAAIIEQGPPQATGVASPTPVAPRSLDDLLRRYKASPRWKKKKPRTQLVQARVFERFFDRVDSKDRRFGARPVDRVTVGWLDRQFGDMIDTPGAANDLRKKMAVLMDFACAIEWRETNPVRFTSRYDDGAGLHTWTESEISQFRAHHPLGTMARLTMELALNTAARRCNVAELTRDNIVAGRILVDHAKGNNDTSVPMLASTRAAIEALPAAPIRHLVVTQFGRPFSVAGLGNRMRKWCDQAGLPQCSLHGLRKAIARRIAESGGTDAEGQAVTGHKKASTFQMYRAGADRARLADAAMSNLATHFDVQPSKKSQETDT